MLRKRLTRQVVRVTVFMMCLSFCGCGTGHRSDNARRYDTVAEVNNGQFSVELHEGKYWLVDPQGNRFLSIGINTVNSSPFNPRQGSDYYNALNSEFDGDFSLWGSHVISLMRDNGFNTLGAWSDARLYGNDIYGVACLYVTGHAPDRCLDGFRPDFEEKVRNNVQTVLSRYASTENIMGFFLDNEMPWYGTSGWSELPTNTLLETAIAMPREDAAHTAAIDFLIAKYGTVEAFSLAWGRTLGAWEELDQNFMRRCLNEQTQQDRADFVGLAAEAFFSKSSRIVREMAPGKLILGVRFAGLAPEPVIRECGRYCDVISFNHYRRIPEPDALLLARYWVWGGGKPVMITEYSWRAMENSSGNPNSRGAGTVVQTQAERAANYASFVSTLLSYPMAVGAHWFEFADQSPQGRFDGEDSNYGIVDIHNRPYDELLASMARTNSLAHAIHAESEVQNPTQLPEEQEVIFEPGQRPERPAGIDFTAVIPTTEPELFEAPDASIQIASEEEAEVLDLEYDTASMWGCGILFFGPEEYALEESSTFATDLDGYSYLVLDAEIPTGICFDVIVDEAAVAGPDEDFDSITGDDGESFVFHTVYGKGERFRYEFDLHDLQPRTVWGNQRGLRRVDMQAIKGVAIHLHGACGSGVIRIHEFSLQR